MFSTPRYRAARPAHVNAGPRRMPTLFAIASHWTTQEHRFPENPCYPTEFREPCCFACGGSAVVEAATTVAGAWRRAAGQLIRAHLADRCAGGSDRVENVVALCDRCHGEMPPFYDTDMALLWVRAHESISDRTQRELAAMLRLVDCPAVAASAVVQAWALEVAEVLRCDRTDLATLLEPSSGA